MDQPPVDNRTDYKTHAQVLLDRDGEKLSVLVKATYELDLVSGVLELASKERMRPPWFGDVPWGEPAIASIAYPTDVFLRRPGTDVFVVGEACALDDREVPSFDAVVKAGPLEKIVRVFGLRVWEANGAGLTPPGKIKRIELRYDYAWGGFDVSDPQKPVEEARNPVGMGHVRDPKKLTHQPAPQLEDPRALIKDIRTMPPPCSLGPIGRHYQPRRGFAGTYDDDWKEKHAPLLPKDFDDRFNIAASPGLHADVPFAGGEEIGLWNLVPGGGATKFRLPTKRVEISITAPGREPHIVRPRLDTVLIDTLAMGPQKPLAVELCWRTSVPAPRHMKDTMIVVAEKKG
jgi:hypothetical protein